MIRPTILAVAPTGARRGKADHPALPVTPAEIAAEAAACRERGASVLHLHVRDREGRHTLDADAYREAIAAVRAQVGQDLVVQATTEAAGRHLPPAQMQLLRALRPEAASLALREIAPATGDEPELCRLLGWMRDERLAAQIILYDAADVLRLRRMTRRGYLPEAGWSVLLVLGNYNGTAGRPADLLPLLQAGGAQFPDWMVCAFGRNEMLCLAAAAAFGADLRTGFENNLRLAAGAIAPSNAALVQASAATLGVLGLLKASADEVRTLWGIGT